MLVTKEWIESKYKEFNAKYFDGKLPNDIEFKVGKASHNWGYATWIRTGVRGEYSIKAKSITLSNYYDSPEFVKENTLLHEMIHILDYTNHPEHFLTPEGRMVAYDAHGWWFHEIMDGLNKEYGLHIDDHVTKEEVNQSSISIGSHAYKRAENGFYVLFVQYIEGRLFLMTLDESKYQEFMEILYSRWGKYHIDSVVAFKSHSLEYAKLTNSYRQGRVVNTTKMNEIIEANKDDFEKIDIDYLPLYKTI